MRRDIDNIITQVQAQHPSVNVVQMHKTHPADDDGIWWFRLPGSQKDIQVESSTGNSPFFIESDDDLSSSDVLTATSMEEVVTAVTNYLNRQRRS